MACHTTWRVHTPHVWESGAFVTFLRRGEFQNPNSRLAIVGAGAFQAVTWRPSRADPWVSAAGGDSLTPRPQATALPFHAPFTLGSSRRPRGREVVQRAEIRQVGDERKLRRRFAEALRQVEAGPAMQITASDPPPSTTGRVTPSWASHTPAALGQQAGPGSHSGNETQATPGQLPWLSWRQGSDQGRGPSRPAGWPRLQAAGGVAALPGGGATQREAGPPAGGTT